MLQCSGDMRTPSLLNALMCLWDVVFNSLLIFPTRTVTVLGFSFTMWGAGMEVAGAALGTALAEVVTALCMVGAVCLRSPRLRLGLGGSWRMEKKCLTTALRVAVPIAFENSILCLAQVVTTTIVAPLGTVAVAANSLAVTAESLCYMPGFGVATAATTLVGQSLGAERRDLARDFARSSVLLGVLVMSGAALAMFLLAPAVFAMLTPVEEVRRLGTEVLRIEAFAEPLYAASIVTAGALRGAGGYHGPQPDELLQHVGGPGAPVPAAGWPPGAPWRVASHVHRAVRPGRAVPHPPGPGQVAAAEPAELKMPLLSHCSAV